ncbi:DUF4232 domain-containing protein [Arthrobacter sp. 260]|uniref:DUF4232 domain-containing protein n=1 Tax=Arthrobacter sp. 260 TaxID=2735314 RepID=UPI001490B069|nr:DUF4232 domain-containing protein [Arthrobacter sp. 260]NOJ60536.1 DUF4232 domain-containing protein [Arthrobacter sp. 260]
MRIHTRTSSKAAALLAALSTIVLLAGCGTSDPTDQDTTTPAAEVSASAPATEEPTEEQSEAASPAPDTSTTPTGEPSGEPTASEPAEAGMCTAADLSAVVETPMGAGGAGTVERTLILSNASDAECTMTGYPGVSYVDAAEAQVGAPADREPGVEVPTVVLEPGQSAIATLLQTNAQNYGDECNLTDTTGVRIYPPGATDSLIALQESVGCTAEDIVLMTVGPMVAM